MPLTTALPLVASAVCLTALPASAQPQCDNWSPWARFTLDRGADFAAMFRRNAEIRLVARWRACDSPAEPAPGPMVSVDLEFKNPNSQRVHFSFRAYNRVRRRCPSKGERPGGDNGSDELSRVAWGNTALDPGEVMNRKHSIPLGSYDGFVWPCAWFVKIG